MQNFIIIGGGARGIYFTEILENELQCKVKAIVDTYVEGNPFIVKRLKEANIKDVEIINSFEEALERYPSTQVDGAFIMTPEWTHASIFKRLIKGNYNIFLEKPIATTKEDIYEIGRIAKTYPNVIQVGFVLRYSLFYRKIKEWIEEDTLGHIVNITMSERLTIDHGVKFKRSWHRMKEYTGGFINEKCSHDLDLMCWFKEKEAKPIGVFSLGNRGFAKLSNGEKKCSDCQKTDCLYRDDLSQYIKFVEGKVLLDQTASGVGTCIYGNDSDIHDNQSVLVQFDDGSHGNFYSIAMSDQHGRDVLIHFEYGLIVGNLEKGVLEKHDYRTKDISHFKLEGMNMHGGGDTQVVKEFTECILTHSKPYASVDDGLRASLLAFAADESNEKKSYAEVKIEW